MTSDEAKIPASLLQARTKHSHYQTIHPALREVLPDVGNYKPKKLLEEAREVFVSEHVDFNGKTVADIGANTGYFSVAAALKGAKQIDAFEGNGKHAAFLQIASSAIGIEGRLKVHNQYVSFAPYRLPVYDICLCYNVLHHLGDDFRAGLPMQVAITEMKAALVSLVSNNKTVVFQMGYNWKGDVRLPLTRNGLKSELISLVHDALGNLPIEVVTACYVSQSQRYEIANKENLKRCDDMGEFANRPLFIIRGSNRLK